MIPTTSMAQTTPDTSQRPSNASFSGRPQFAVKIIASAATFSATGTCTTPG